MLEGSILRGLEEAHRSAQVGKRPLNFGVYYKNTLVALCHALEDCILTSRSQPLVITAFQRGKWYLEEADRYGELAARSRHVVIMAAPDAGFAEHPTSQRPTVDLVNLNPEDAVAQEWHLVIFAPTYSAMVLCQELSETDYGRQGPPAQDLERKFYGFWTFEPNLVRETMDLAIAHIHRYNPSLAEQLTAQVQDIAAQQSREREDLGAVVARVVDYLQSGQADLDHHRRSDAPVLRQDILDSNLVSNEVQAFLRMAQLTDQADATNPSAAAEVAALAEAIGQLLDLPAWQLHRLKLAGLLHRLAPLQRAETVFNLDQDSGPSCPLVPGAQVLRTMPQLRAIAAIITHQTEHWDGSGQPAGLSGDAIPLESRILGLVAEFQQQFAQFRSTDATSSEAAIEKALAACRQQDNRWDPKLLDTLTLLVGGFQQGLNLPVTTPKISAGLWLIDSHCGEEVLNFSQ
ncbi:metal-dependent phosphohydrolase [Leptolyngbya sp. FACHB-36]|uniref:DICT sensory domain-containing protein n=1 Tax=Leptolyngbya sp. FACHB-36 TaxID=2692808 RepID=UPI0016811FD0|nr:DICT sensory domain-containing protein [Leptolyngbya sp. FACHB-36]MBD2020813.1 metal-dependent phosphohydrolase [Leptolyngbya sp. FACHB-36]